MSYRKGIAMGLNSILSSPWRLVEIISQGILVLTISGVINVSSLGGGLDWLLPPLRTPCPARNPQGGVVVSTQTTYTPRFGWGLLGGDWGAVTHSGVSPIPSYGVGQSPGIQIAPVVVLPRGEGIRYLTSPPIYGYLCAPSVAAPGWSFPGTVLNGCAGTPGTLLLPGQPAYYPKPTASGTLLPGPQNGLLPQGLSSGTLLPAGEGGGLLPGPSGASTPSFGGAYSTPASPQQLPSPQPVGTPFYEKAGSALSEPAGGSLPGSGIGAEKPIPAESSPGVEKPPGTLQNLPPAPPVLEQKAPLLNAPENPNGPNGAYPTQRKLVPLPTRNPGLEPPSSPNLGKPNPGDRAT